jgi:Glycogen recognition site of AMP-activated protein kinase
MLTMGNSPSSTARSATASPAGSTHGALGTPPVRREPKLRDNIQAQRVAAPPEPSLAQARGTNVIHGSRKSHSQPHSQSHSQSPSHSQSHHTHAGIAPPTMRDQMNGQQLKSLEPKPEVKDQPSKPVAVPAPPNTDPASLSPIYSSSMEPSAPLVDAMSYHLTRPPRLPLPIEEEVHTPGSPIIAPADADAPLLDIEALEADNLPRPSSTLSSTTAEDDEDAEELPIDKTKAVVPIEFEWSGGGEKVYVTGTIFQWSRKSKLYRV